jgi:dihydrofolate synthase/folylpolyglutamate synthase
MGREFGYIDTSPGTEFWCGDQRSQPLSVHLPKASLAAAWQAVRLVSPEVRPEVLASVTLPGRLQRLEAGRREVFLDVAHNPAAMSHLAAQFRDKKFLLVIAMMGDKNLHDSLAALVPIAGGWLLTTIADLPRAASIDQLRQALPPGAAADMSDSVSTALERALTHPSQLPVLVTGSFYTVAAATEYLRVREEKIHEILG